MHPFPLTYQAEIVYCQNITLKGETMRFFGIMFALTGLMLGLYGNGVCAEGAKVVVTVNGVQLTEADLNQEVQTIVPMESSFHGGVSPEKMKVIRSKAMDTLVEKELKYQDALSRGLNLGEGGLDAEIEKIKVRFKGKGDIEKLIVDGGFSPTSFKRFVERKILADKVTAEVVDKNVHISDDMVTAYYAVNKSRYMKPREFRTSHILVKVEPSLPDDEKAKLKGRAESLLKRIKDGAGFAELAEKESDDLTSIKGGDLGFFHEGQTQPEFEDAVKTLKVGEVSTVVETLFGFHIIKLTDKKEPRQLPLDELKDKIRGQLTENEKERLYNVWVGGLKAKAKIVYHEEG